MKRGSIPYSLFLFTAYFLTQARIDQLKLMGPVILTGILKSLDGYSASDSGLLLMEPMHFKILLLYSMMSWWSWLVLLLVYIYPISYFMQMLLLGKPKLLPFKQLVCLRSACLSFSGIFLKLCFIGLVLFTLFLHF